MPIAFMADTGKSTGQRPKLVTQLNSLLLVLADALRPTDQSGFILRN